MLKKRIIPCLDIKDGLVVKGVQFKNHEVLGDVFELASQYNRDGADELVFYDITASPENRVVHTDWVQQLAITLSIPFCVAGGIKSLEDATRLLDSGAEKISVNSMAFQNPTLIDQIAQKFGSQALVIGIDSSDGYVHQFTGDPTKSRRLRIKTTDWAREVVNRGAGEIVLNCMKADGLRTGYDIQQLKMVSDICHCPIVASGGAGKPEDFEEVFRLKNVTGALAASIFHKKIWPLPKLRMKLLERGVPLRKMYG